MDIFLKTRRMKKKLLIFGLAIIMFIVSSCGLFGSDEIQGVTVTDSGNVTVTFTVPENMTIGEVLGSEIGEETPINITDLSESRLSKGFCYVSKVDIGGLVCRYGNIYRYGPNAEYERSLGLNLSPSPWVLITSSPSDDAIFNPKDSQKLEEKHGIKLNFESN